MTQQRKINPLLKAALEFGPVIAFFVAYLRLKGQSVEFNGTQYDGFIIATAGFVLLLLIATGILWLLTRHLSKMQVVTLVMVIIFGGLSVWLNDDRFIKLKPTLIYVLFGGVLAFGLMRGQSYLRFAMEEVMPLQHTGWMILTKRLMWCFFTLALMNELIWRNLSTETWVYFKTFGLTAAVFVFFIGQGRLFQTYALEQTDADDA